VPWLYLSESNKFITIVSEQIKDSILEVRSETLLTVNQRRSRVESAGNGVSTF
jgi:hypothetical protein